MRFGLSSLLLGSAAGGSGSAPVTELIALTTIGTDASGATHVNSAILRSVSSDVPRNTQILAYHTEGRVLKYAKRTYTGGGVGGAWTATATGITVTTPSDAHNFFSSCVDDNGRVLTAGNMHGDPMKSHIASGVDDLTIAAWDATPTGDNAALELEDTYPVFCKLPSGTILRFFRSGESGNGELSLQRLPLGGTTWQTVAAALVSGVADPPTFPLDDSFYPDQITVCLVGGVVRIPISGCWRDSTYLNTNHDRIYFYLESSDDFLTVNAKKASGAAQTVPVTRANADYAAVRATGTGIVNTGTNALDADGDPVIMTFADPGHGFTQILLHYWKSGAWHEEWVPGDTLRQQNVPFSVVGLTDTWTWSALASPGGLRIRNGRATTLVQCVAKGPGIWALICEEPTYKQWAWRQLTNEDVQEWFCATDAALWDAYHEYHCLVQKAQRPQVPPSSLGAQTVKELTWRPQSAAYGYIAPAAPWDPTTLTGCVFYGSARVKCTKVHGTQDANRTRCNELWDARTQTAIYVQASNSDAPEFIYNSFTSALEGHSGGIKFVSANTDKFPTTDATLLAALDGTNQPLTIGWAGRLEALSADSCLWSFGSSSTHYMFCTVLADGSIRFARRSGGAEVNCTSAAGLVTAGGNHVITVRYDGTYAEIWLDGAIIVQATAMSSAGSMVLDTGMLCARWKGATDQVADATLAAVAMSSSAVALSERRAMELGMAAERAITIAHDGTAPALSTAVVPSAGTTLVLTYGETLDPSSVPAAGDFSLAGTSATIASVSLSGAAVTLNLTGTILGSQTVTVSYVVPGSGKIRDGEQNNAAALTGRSVTNNSSAQASPTFVGEAHQTDISSTTRTPDLSGLGLATNDIILMTIGSRIGGTVSITEPAGEGWTKITESERIVAGSLECTYWKRWGSGSTDDSTPTFTCSVSGLSWYATATVWRGCKTSGNPYTVTPVRVDHAANNTLTAGLLGSAPGGASTTVWLFQSTDDNSLNANTRGTLDLMFNCNSVACCAVVHEAAVDSSVNACVMTESAVGPDTARILTLALSS